jgi:DNA-binding CsgD family transcriptional regulator
MEISNNNPGTKFPARPDSAEIKNDTSIPDVNRNENELKHTIVLDVPRGDKQPVVPSRYIIEILLREDFSLADQNIENSLKELTLNEKDLTPKPVVDDKTYLTCREIEIMEKLSKGWPNKLIADDLGLTENTVRVHLQNIYPKLGVVNRTEAIIEYLKNPEKYKKKPSSV